MSMLDTPIERRKVLKGFLIAGPTLAVAARLGVGDGAASAFPTETDELPDAQDFTEVVDLLEKTAGGQRSTVDEEALAASVADEFTLASGGREPSVVSNVVRHRHGGLTPSARQE